MKVSHICSSFSLLQMTKFDMRCCLLVRPLGHADHALTSNPLFQCMVQFFLKDAQGEMLLYWNKWGNICRQENSVCLLVVLCKILPFGGTRLEMKKTKMDFNICHFSEYSKCGWMFTFSHECWQSQMIFTLSMKKYSLYSLFRHILVNTDNVDIYLCVFLFSNIHKIYLGLC